MHGAKLFLVLLLLLPLPCCCCCCRLTLTTAAAYDQAVLALMSDPEVVEDLFSVMSAGEGGPDLLRPDHKVSVDRVGCDGCCGC